MIALTFDTETTGKYDFKQPDNFDIQPGMVQLGAELFDTDTERVMAEVNLIVFEDMEIEAGALAVHGITPEDANRFGVRPRVACAMLVNLMRLADCLVGFNIGFDKAITRVCMVRQEMQEAAEMLMTMQNYCMMHTTTPICRIPKAGGGYKWPKLMEAYKALVNPAGFDDAHDAMADVRATRELFQAVLRGGYELKVGR